MNLFDLLTEKHLPLFIDVDGEPIYDPYTLKLLDFLERFQDRLTDLNNAGTNGCEDSCLVYRGSINSNDSRTNGGYSQTRVPWGKMVQTSETTFGHEKMVVHRAYYLLTHGQLSAVSKDSQLGHYCFGDDGFKGTRKKCVRHVRIITASENMGESIHAQKKQKRIQKSIEEKFPLFPMDEGVCAWAVKHCQL